MSFNNFNPGMQGGYNPYPTPYQAYYEKMQQINQMQQMAQNPNSFLNGKIVDSFDHISANDVPLSGFATFVKSDFSEIEIRQWSANGTITKAVYKPLKEEPIEATQDRYNELTELIKSFDTRFDSIENAINGIKPAAGGRK